MMREGSRVSYVGEGHDGLTIGDQGRVLVTGPQAAHVQWTTGSRKGQVDLMDTYDLAPPKTATTELDDSLEVTALAVTAARDVLDTQGEVGLLNLMADQGHLGAFEAIASNALAGIQAEIRNDPSFRSVMAQLDDDEADSLVRLASLVLVRDAFASG